MRLAKATHSMRRTDYLPAYYAKPVRIDVYRPHRPPRREGEHRIFTDRRTGKTMHAVFCRATPTHWLVRLHRDRNRTITRLSRSRWAPTWKVCVVHFVDTA